MKETKVYSVDKFENTNKFCSYCCEECTAMSDGYCPSDCDVLEKARKMPFEKINAKWIEHDGDIQKVVRYIKQYNLRSKI